MTATRLATRLAAVREAIGSVADPEMDGVTVGQLGMVRDVRITDGNDVLVDLSPTFLGCVAIGLIVLDIESTALRSDASLSSCHVNLVHHAWSPDRISATGVDRLRALGIAVVRSDRPLEAVDCPFCGNQTIRRRGGAGPTRCRQVAWCDTCRNVVELMESPSPIGR